MCAGKAGAVPGSRSCPWQQELSLAVGMWHLVAHSCPVAPGLPCPHASSLWPRGALCWHSSCSPWHLCAAVVLRYSSKTLQVLENSSREGREEGRNVPVSPLVAQLLCEVAEHGERASERQSRSRSCPGDGERPWQCCELAEQCVCPAGTEGEGLSLETQLQCHRMLAIPPGRALHPGIDSLNVSVAAGESNSEHQPHLCTEQSNIQARWMIFLWLQEKKKSLNLFFYFPTGILLHSICSQKRRHGD